MLRMLRRGISSHAENIRMDPEEHSKFLKLSQKWWSKSGEFKALHSMNRLRISLVRDGLLETSGMVSGPEGSSRPLTGLKLLDIGCGGGIVSEPLARLGASVTGIDLVKENIDTALARLEEVGSRENDLSFFLPLEYRINYLHCSAEDLLETEAESFDGVVASEVLEHVSNWDGLLSTTSKLIKPGGSIFLTTLNRTQASYWMGIFAAEKILCFVPSGTHDWHKFISPDNLQYSLLHSGFNVRLIHGMCYNPVTDRWSWTGNTDINYAVHAVKDSDLTSHT